MRDDHERTRRVTIGVLAGWQFYWTATPLSYLAPLFRGMSLAAQNLGCNLLLGCGMGSSASVGDPLRPAWPVPAPDSDFVPIGPWNTDGLIAVNPLHSTVRSRYIQDLIAAGYPVLFIASGESGPALVADSASGIREAMGHLVAHGHRRIAFIAGSPEDMHGDSGDRLGAFQAALQTHGLPADPRLVAYGRHVYDVGYAAARQILDSGAPFTAVLASNDESALGAIRALKEAGRRIPQDVAVIGFDDRPESAVQEPPLSSVRIPLFNMGYRAVELLAHSIADQVVLTDTVRIPTRLVPRDSCGCGRDRGFAALFDVSARSNYKAARADVPQAMSAIVLTQAPGWAETDVEAACMRLVDALDTSIAQDDPSDFCRTLDTILQAEAFEQDDAHAWQAAITVLQERADATAGPASHRFIRALLDWARMTISGGMRRQYRQFAVNEHWTNNRVGVLTAELLTALDETRVFQILAQHLPEMGIQRAWLALFEAGGDDSLTWCSLRSLTTPNEPAALCLSREFPPHGLLPVEEPFSLALLPLVSQRGQLGFVAFESDHLDLYGAIVQQLAAALNTSELYREAMEGRRLAEEENRLKSRFLSTVSHELRTPLNLIVGLSGILLEEGNDDGSLLPGTLRTDLERINANAQHLSGLIGDVLDLASSDAGMLRMANEYVDLGQTLRAVAETGRRLAQDKGLAWHASLPDAGPWILGDHTRLRQVALNLISNAIKFTAHGFVTLTLETGAGFATVTVRDSGLGIPPEEQRSIFSEFRRSERSITRGHAGLGLGLAICKRLIEMHGGSIGVHSTGEEGGGSTFYFTLPTVSLPEVQVKGLPAVSGGAEYVLVLTNQASSGRRLKEHLSQRGIEAQLALMADSADWSGRLAAAAPSAVVLDMTSEAEHGWQTFKALKGNPVSQGVPVLFYALAEDTGSVLELDYLTKPIELTQLTRALDQHWLASGTDRAARTLLVVDDDPSTLDMYIRIVHTHWPNERVLSASNGREALDIVRHERLDLVLLDLMMPEIDGFGVLETMRREDTTRSIPVIVVTGQVLSQQDMARLDQSVAAVLSKGVFTTDETLAHLDTALERRRKLNSEAQRLVRHAMAYIHEHYAEPISRQDLASRVHMADDYLTACFHKEVGMGPIEYLNRYRVGRAKLLLKQSKASITAVALAVGFSDSGYFSRVFRREVGVSPQAYRRT